MKRAFRIIVYLFLFGTDSGFAFKFLGRHEKVEQGNQRPIDGIQEGLFFNPLKPVITDIFPDHGTVFLFNETVVIFLVVAASGKRDAIFFTPDFGGIVDKLRTIIAVELHDRGKCGSFDVGQGLEGPLVSVIEEGTKLYPAGSDIGGGQRMQVVALCRLSTMMNSVDLPKPRLLSFFLAIESTDRDAAFQGIYGFRETFPFQPEGRLVFFQGAVYGGGTYLF